MKPVPALSLLQEHGVHLLGDFTSQCGLSQSARDVLETVRSLGWPVEVLDLPLFASRGAEADAVMQRLGDLPVPASRLSLLNLNADNLPELARRLPAAFFRDRYLIGIWYWETADFPPHHRAGFDFVDEVWVASSHIRRALEKVAPVPVRQFTPLVHPPAPAGPAALPDALQNDRFLFLFCFDYRSTTARKNPGGPCGAFVRAFPAPAPDGPLCVIKSTAAHPDHTLEFLDLRRRFRHRPDILFMDGWLSPAQRDGLMNRADCYVSMHRAEGLGLTILESMSLGKPCLGTAYSGNLDFMTPDNSWLIPCRMVPVGPRRWPFPSDDTWAEPDTAAAAAAMREAFSNPDLLAQKGRCAKETVLTRHGPAPVSLTMQDLLQDAIVRAARLKPGIAPDPSAAPSLQGRARALQLQQQARTLHASTRDRIAKLQGWNVSPELLKALKAILGWQKLQLDVQSRILRELRALQCHQAGYDASSFDHLIHHQSHVGEVLRDLMESPSANPSGPK